MSQSVIKDTNNSLQDSSVQEKEASVQEKEEESPTEFPTMKNRILIMISLYFSIFLVTLVSNYPVFE